MEVNSDNVDQISKKLAPEIQAALERAGLSGYKLDSISLSKADEAMSPMGLLPGCELKCKLEGFPPSVKCEVVCG